MDTRRTVLRRDNQWDIPRKRALFISDGPDSTTSGNDIPEGHSDRPLIQLQMLRDWFIDGQAECALRRGVFFVRDFDPYDGSMSDSRRVVSVLAYRMAGGPHRRPVHSWTGASSRAPELADGRR